jgi:formylglycine-generating enzyme required for sulfatase activity
VTSKPGLAAAAALLVLSAACAARADGGEEKAPAPPVAVPEKAEPKSGLVYLQLPGGPFHLGCEPGDPDCLPDEKPGKDVTVRPFALSKLETTVGAYGRCVKEGACTPPATGYKCNWGEGKDTHPVNCVSWEQAKTFCDWAGGRLPTAEEWEYSAKGGSGRVYPWGNGPPTEELVQFASKEGTAPAGGHVKGASLHGAFDLAGNVWEWTSSDYDDDNKEVRGGGWQLKQPKFFRASIRYKCPGSNFNDNIGFRCAQ